MTTPTVKALLLLLIAMPRWHGDRDDTEEQRRAILAPVAAAQHAACKDAPKLLAGSRCYAALTAVAQHETHLARYILEGRCEDGPRGQRCDWDDSTKQPRARGAYQIWQSVCPEAWRHPAGSAESTRLEARCAVRRLTGAYYRCRGRHPGGDWAGMFAGYRSIDCTWRGRPKDGALARVRTMQLIQYRLAE